MSKKPKHQKRAPAARPADKPAGDSHRYWIAALVLANLIFFWTPLTSSNTSIQWDAGDYYYVVQKYFSNELHAGRMPFWTPYVWAGFPFLADPQVGAWYPLNWPFFAIGVSPRTIQIENFLHSLIGCLGAYFLAFRLLAGVRAARPQPAPAARAAAALAGLCYGLSGWFVGHSSHTTMVEVAAWLPWLLFCFLAAAESRRSVYALWAVLVAALIIVAGHFQTTLYSFLALGLFAVALCAANPANAPRLLSMALAIPAGGTLLSTIFTLPGLELVAQSVRAAISASTRTEGFLHPGTLATLLYPDYYGAIGGNYRGPADITQYYLYAGLLLVPLAIVGVMNKRVRWIALSLVGFTVWYAAGRAGGLFYLMARVPGFSSVRAPINVWFVPALGLALLAAAGLVYVAGRWKIPWLPVALVVVTFCDIWYWNSEKNPLAYARFSYEELYGRNEDAFERTVGAHLPVLTRFSAPERLPTFGPMSHPLDTRIETSYGYGPLVFQRYTEYKSAMLANPKLMNDLNISRYYDVRNGQVTMASNPDVLPRANFPKQLTRTQNPEQSLRALATLDPALSAIVPADVGELRQDGAASVEILEHTPGEYRMRYQAASDSLLRISAAWFPGWRARVDGRDLKVFCVDHALMGVVVPAGQKELLLTYHSTYFAPGAAITLVSLGAWVATLLWVGKRRGAAGESREVLGESRGATHAQ